MVQQLRHYETDVQRYLFLRELQRVNADLFYAVLLQHTGFVLPFLYTPTVGVACQQYFHLPIPTYGLWLTCNDQGSMLQKLSSYPQQDIRVVVVTDGERILGLGDLGAGGMGICEGKSLLYTAAAGVHPEQILPVHFDVGTNNPALLADPLYRGLKQRRLTGPAYMAVVDEFMSALAAWRPHVLLQFEDFANHTAFDLLARYRSRACCFNDDIHGTACVTLAGLLAAMRASGRSLADSCILFLGAGEAGTGIADLIAFALHRLHGIPVAEGRKRCIFLDSKGLVCASRTNLQPHKRMYAHDLPPCKSLLEAVRTVKPHALIGVSTIAGAFSPQVLREMACLNERPIVFSLSNPTSKSECTFQQAMDATDGRVLFASGSPFDPLEYAGRTYTPCQANNAYVFPAIGHAAVLCRARSIPDDVFLAVAQRLAGMTGPQEWDQGMLFPSFDAIMNVSAKLMAAAAQQLLELGQGSQPAEFERVVADAGASLAGTNDMDVQAKWEVYSRAKMYRAKQSRI